MGSDLLRRVRWRNVGRAGGAVLVVAAVVAWPRLNPPPPRLPDPAARPLLEPTPEGAGYPRDESVVRPRNENIVRPRDEPRRGGSAKAERSRAKHDRPRSSQRRQRRAGRRRERVRRSTGTPAPATPHEGPDDGIGVEGPDEGTNGATDDGTGRGVPDEDIQGTWVAPDERAPAPPDDNPAQREFGIER